VVFSLMHVTHACHGEQFLQYSVTADKHWLITQHSKPK